MKKNVELLKAAVLFPGSVLVLIPFLILYFTGPSCFLFGTMSWGAWVLGAVALFLLLTGFYFSLRTMMLFFTLGDGTPAPWAPPRNFVVSGPYCYVRNPMLLSVMAILAGEGILFGSFPIMAWCGLFWAASTLYFIHIEEPGLVQRFGGSYLEYKKNVGRWVPRFTPWKGQ